MNLQQLFPNLITNGGPGSGPHPGGGHKSPTHAKMYETVKALGQINVPLKKEYNSLDEEKRKRKKPC